MRMIVLSALFALGLGLAGTTGAPAATIGGGINNAANNYTAIQSVALRCRVVRRCWRGPRGRRHCEVRRICRRW